MFSFIFFLLALSSAASFLHSRCSSQIDRVHKRALRILLGDYTSSFDELLQKIDDTRVHVKNLRNLMVEIYKCLSCEIYVEYFPAKRAWV